MTTQNNIYKFGNWDFAGSIQRNYGEFLEAAISWHYEDFTKNGANPLESTDEEIEEDVMNIADNIIKPDYDGLERPDGRVIMREELEEDIRDQIKEIYS